MEVIHEQTRKEAVPRQTSDFTAHPPQLVSLAVCDLREQCPPTPTRVLSAVEEASSSLAAERALARSRSTTVGFQRTHTSYSSSSFATTLVSFGHAVDPTEKVPSVLGGERTHLQLPITFCDLRDDTTEYLAIIFRFRGPELEIFERGHRQLAVC